MSPNQPLRKAYVAFGANIGNPAAAFRFSCARIGALPRTRLIAQSSLYRTSPVGVDAQPDYLNAVIVVETRLAPLTLLEALLAIEIEGGRTRAFENSPRTLDLDLLLFGSDTLSEPELTIPHPRMHIRGFVLVPLAEIAPDLEIPGKGLVSALLESISDQVVMKLDS